MLETAILIVMVIVALAIVGLILIQQGKGADMGASFGSGASNTMFGSAGSGNFLSHTTAVLAAVFFACCLALAWFTNNSGNRAGTIDFSTPEVQLKEVPAPSDIPSVTPAQPATGDVPAAPAATEAPAPAAAAPAPQQDATRAQEQPAVPQQEVAPAQEEKTQ